MPFQSQLLQAVLRGAVPKLVLAKKHGNPLRLFFLMPQSTDKAESLSFLGIGAADGHAFWNGKGRIGRGRSGIHGK